MFLTPLDIKILSDSISISCQGGQVQKISLILPSGIQLTIRSHKGTKRILIFDTPHHPAILAVKEGWKFLSKENPQFLQLLKKYIKGNVIKDVNQLNNDRIISIVFNDFTLIAECVEKFPNIYLLNGENKLIASHLSPRTPLMLNETFSLPPVAGKISKVSISDKSSPDREIFKRIEKTLESQNIQNVIRKIKKDIKKKKILIERLKGELDTAKRCEKIKREGELLKRVKNIPFGSSSVEVVDYESYPPQNLVIEIDKSVDPRQYIGMLFSKYKKLKRSQIELEKRISILNIEIKKLSEELDKIESEGLELKLETYRKKSRRKKDVKVGPREFKSSDGFSIFVARNVEQGEQLVRQAKGNDLWLHVLNAPGPHVIIHRKSRKPIPRRTIVEASALAIYFSSLKRQGKGEATVAERRYVKSVKGILGKVTYSRGETVSVKIDDEKMKVLFERGAHN